ncbi:glycosyltransferase family 1 protein [Candidatus Uhrbacteria bacterium]|nr:glycosyltransferase family 1 protein [Candidatus Uhrbacteria bacterium]
MKRILLVSPPFSGHLNVLKLLASQYADVYDFSLAITGWKNIEPDFSGFDGEVDLLAKQELDTADPAMWTFSRMNELIPDLRNVVDRIRPDLIVYDFFSLEGYCVGKEKGITVWCSIPAFLGPNDNQTYLEHKFAFSENQEAWNQLQRTTDTLRSLSQIEMISDGFHLPGDVNLVWSYESLIPKNYQEGRANAPYVFLGSLTKSSNLRIATKRPVVYVSFGTVVMDNLWNHHKDIQMNLLAFFQMLAELWSDAEFDVVCVTRGKPILQQAPSNWRLVAHANQLEELAYATIFVTHGGSNSFHESLVSGVPMVVVPFFGDQILVAKQVEALQIGTSLVQQDSIDTGNAGTQLSAHTAVRVDQAVKKILADVSEYKRHIEMTDLHATSFPKVIEEFFHREI